MRGRLMFLAGAGAGYVLGAKAGRGRYEQIKTQADQIWNDPKVQEKVSAAQTLVTEKVKEAAPVVQDKIGEAASVVKDKAGDAAAATKDKAGEAADKAKGAAEAAKDKAAEARSGDDDLDFSANDENMLTGAEKGSDYSPHETKYTTD